MNIQDAKGFYSSMINELIDNFDFGDFLFYNRTQKGALNWRTNYINAIIEYYKEKPEDIDIWFASGSTKFVIGSPQIGYVIKIPFAGMRHDYCQEEKNIYDEACDSGIGCLFAQCDILGDFEPEKNSPYTATVYIMEYAECDERKACNEFLSSWPHMAKSYYIDNCSEEMDEDATLAFLEQEWGNDVFDRFISFYQDFDLNDIHSANIGFDGENWIVIDYSGYEG